MSEQWTTADVRNAVRATLRHPRGLASVNDILEANEEAADPVWAEDDFVTVVVDKLRAAGATP